MDSPDTDGDSHTGPVRIFVIDCNATMAALERHEERARLLSGEEQQRFSKIEKARGLNDARIWRASHIALRAVLAKLGWRQSAGMPFVQTSAGRPIFADGGSPSFSLAHAGPLAMVAAGGVGPVGVDLETVRAVRMSAQRQDRIEAAAQMLAPLSPLPGVGDEGRFLQAWVRLEAFAKAGNFGIGRVLTAAGAVGGENGERFSELLSEGRRLGQVTDLDAGQGRFAAVFAPDSPAEIAVEVFPESFNELTIFLEAGPGQ